MPNQIIGSTWNKWDLHIHTPDSLIHNYPGDYELAWENFLADLERLPPEFKVIGINDYLFIDGYERVLKAKRDEGRLANIDLILPVIELRLDKFGGVLEVSKEGGYEQSGWSRINLHVIFDQVEPDLIRQQFLSAIGPSYSLVPGSSGAGKWNSVITRESLKLLGQEIINSVPEDKRRGYSTPLKEGFNALNVSLEGVIKALNTNVWAGKYLIAIGKTEWENLKWSDHTIADKKTVINEADLIFTAAENPAAYSRALKGLTDSNVNSNLLDCSDAHWFSDSSQKDRIGNCFTWIKSETTFEGLLQAIEEFQDRIYIGDIPPKKQLVEQNKTKFIESVRVKKKHGSTLTEPWFDVDISLNSDLVAIIGNKGSGKSALSDIIALVGDTRNSHGFSFLKENRFRNSRAKFAQHFVGELVWRDGSESSRELDSDPDLSAVERVKYLPQSYLETLCNELGEGGSVTFDAELRKIIYSHVPEEGRLNQSSMDDLLDFKVAEINQARHAVRQEISKLNAAIINIEEKLAPGFKKYLEEQLLIKNGELAAMVGAKPPAIEDPNSSPQVLEESKIAVEEIEALEKEAQKVVDQMASLREQKALLSKKQALVKRILQALSNHKRQYQSFLDGLIPLLTELDVAEISAEKLLDLRITTDSIDALAVVMQEEIINIDNQLMSSEPGSLAKQNEGYKALIEAAKNKLGEQQRQFVRYREDLAIWEKSKADILGSIDRTGTISWLKNEIQSLVDLPRSLSKLESRRDDLSIQIYKYTEEMVNEYRRLYEPVQEFVESAEQMDMKLPLDFTVNIEEVGFQDQFLGRVNRQAKGSFSGIDESAQIIRSLLQESNFDTEDRAVAFARNINDMLRYDRRDDKGVKTNLFDQLRKGVEPLEMLDYLFGFEYLIPRYSLTFDGQEIGQLSPGERGLLLLVFYLLVDKGDIPIVIDQPEENLDNQTIFNVLVKCIKKAKERRQVIIVTHNPNLAVVCDAEQLIYASCDKSLSKFNYESGAIECGPMKARVVQILEGTEPAFRNRQSKYRL